MLVHLGSLHASLNVTLVNLALGQTPKKFGTGSLVAAPRGGYRSEQSARLFSLSLLSTVAACDRKMQVLLALWPSVL